MNTPGELFDFYEAYLNIYEAQSDNNSNIPNSPNAVYKTALGRLSVEQLRTLKQLANKQKLERSFRAKSATVEDSVEYVLNYLIDEGFTDSYEGAEAILETMSDEWLEDIIEAKVDSGLPDDVKSLVRNQRRGLEPKLKSTNVRRKMARSGRGLRGNIGDPLTSAKYERYHTNNPNGYPGLPWN
jgi:hypothetical protein